MQRSIRLSKVDLLVGGDGHLKLLDFKASPRPALLARYERQLCTYARMLATRYGMRPDCLFLYWTAEPRKQDALMEFPHRLAQVAAAGTYFDQVVTKILPISMLNFPPATPSSPANPDLYPRTACGS